MVNLSGCRVLIVEDEFFLADDAALELSAAGATIVGPVGRLEEARAQVEADGFDVALIDIKLGEEMAYPLADMLAAQGIPFAFVTGYEQSFIPDRFAGVPYVVKPVTNGALLELIEALCASAPAHSRRA